MAASRVENPSQTVRAAASIGAGPSGVHRPIRYDPDVSFPASAPARQSQRRTRSSTRRAIGPIRAKCCRRCPPGSMPSAGQAPSVGVSELTPHHAAGRRSEPARSAPISRRLMPLATAAAPPPELPPAVKRGSCGLLVRPRRRLSVWKSSALGGNAVLPVTSAPSSTSLATIVALARSARRLGRSSPNVRGHPPAAIWSLIVTGRPFNDPFAVRGDCSRRASNALTTGSTSSRRARKAP